MESYHPIMSKLWDLGGQTYRQRQTHTISSLHSLWENIHFSCYIFSHMQIKRVNITTRRGVFIFHLSGQEFFCIGIGSRDQVLKAPPFSYCDQPCRDWRKMRYMFPRVGHQCKLKGFWSSVDLCLAPEITSWSDKPVGSSVYNKGRFSAKLWTPNNGGRSSWWF